MTQGPTHHPGRHTSYSKLRILYVTSNTTVAFQIINQGVIESFHSVVREIRVINAKKLNVLNTALEMKPDLVLFISGNVIRVDELQELRKRNIKSAVWYTDNPYNTDFIAETAPHYDFVFTTEIACLSFFHLIGCSRVHLLPLAANTRVFYPNPPGAQKIIDICFIGSAWSNRIQLIDQLASYLYNKNVFIAGPGWDRLAHYNQLSGKIHNDALEMHVTRAYIAKSKIVINSHRAYNESFDTLNSRMIYAHSANPRVFEICATESFQLSDNRADLDRCYKVGSELDTYENAQDLIHKIKYYLAHENIRREIASNGLKRTLKEHTYPHRIKEILSIVFD
ncbi:CgeB family protein [Ferviditalea candida]|uniref:Glycosyltransferase n=1 Tax=Ferviditalea candida TaxID=3108399 RepID=A0ABU5ZD47_9BACL|nr:glycosyltransferase [Paenibacillaceae bacterium T2]